MLNDRINQFKKNCLALESTELSKLNELLYLMSHEDLLLRPFKIYENLLQNPFILVVDHRKHPKLVKEFNEILIQMHATPRESSVGKVSLEQSMKKDWGACEALSNIDAQNLQNNWLKQLAFLLKNQKISNPLFWASDLFAEAYMWTPLFWSMRDIYFFSLFTDEKNEQAEKIISCMQQLEIILSIDGLLTDFFEKPELLPNSETNIEEMINPNKNKLVDSTLLDFYLKNAIRFAYYYPDLARQYVGLSWGMTFNSYRVKLMLRSWAVAARLMDFVDRWLASESSSNSSSYAAMHEQLSSDQSSEDLFDDEGKDPPLEISAPEEEEINKQDFISEASNAEEEACASLSI